MPVTPFILPAGATVAVSAPLSSQLDRPGYSAFGCDGLGWGQGGSLDGKSGQGYQTGSGRDDDAQYQSSCFSALQVANVPSSLPEPQHL
jgi:hypothetical protein